MMAKIGFKASIGTGCYDVFVDGVKVGEVHDKRESYSGIVGRNGRPLGTYRYWRFTADGIVWQAREGWFSTRRDAVADGLRRLGIEAS